MSYIKYLYSKNEILIKNFSFLSSLQILNLVIPLAVYPYLIRVLGSEIYGVIVYAQAILGYFQILVNFGFNVSATKDISLNRNNKNKLIEIVSSVLIIKGILFIVTICFLSILISFIPQGSNYKLLFYLSLWLCLYDLIFPVWYFQGVERMKYITYFTIISRSLFVVLIFIFVKSSAHYLRVPLINGTGALIAGIISLWFILKVDKISFKIQSFRTLKKYFLKSIPLFVSGISVKLFVDANKIIIGSLLGMNEVAYYDLAEKIVNFLKTPQLIVSQVIFPKVSKNPESVFLKKMLRISLVIACILVCAIQIFATKLIFLLGGESMMPAVPLLRIFSIVIIIVYISQYTTVLSLLSNGLNKIYMKIIMGSGILYILCVSIIYFSNIITPQSLIFTSIITELFLLISGYIVSKRLNLI